MSEKTGIEWEIMREIRNIREKKGISRKELCENIGVSERTFADFELEKSQKIPSNVLLDACIFLGINILKFTNPKEYEKYQNFVEEKESSKVAISETDIQSILSEVKDIKNRLIQLDNIEHILEGLVSQQNMQQNFKTLLKQMLNENNE